ncbi:hypothetical protein VNI00_007713 [Paramarasmius palmivorus]|uniref:Uncharacterized protein n=1 Tax=Paramarasmius palmivorus TaxID=297713 RepID=A0AAW0D3E4_9AGAR
MRACLALYFSHSSRLFGASNSPFYSFKPSRFVQLLSADEGPNHSVYSLVDFLDHPQNGLGTLFAKNLPSARAHQRKRLMADLGEDTITREDVGRWNPLLRTDSIERATAYLSRLGYITKPTETTSPLLEYGLADNLSVTSPDRTPIPSWVLLYLVAHKVRIPPHAAGPMLDLVLSNLPHLERDLQPGLIILSTLNLAKFNAILPIHLLTAKFLQIDFGASNSGSRSAERHFNLLLQAIKRNPIRSTGTAGPLVTLLKSMYSRRVPLWEDNCDELLKDRFVVVELTKWLRERAVGEGLVPTREQLLEHARLFAGKRPAIEDEQRYIAVLKELDAEREASVSGEAAKESSFFSGSERLTKDRFSAIWFLRSLTWKITPRYTEKAALPWDRVRWRKRGIQSQQRARIQRSRLIGRRRVRKSLRAPYVTRRPTSRPSDVVRPSLKPLARSSTPSSSSVTSVPSCAARHPFPSSRTSSTSQSPPSQYRSPAEVLQGHWLTAFRKATSAVDDVSAWSLVTLFEWAIPSTAQRRTSQVQVKPTRGLYTELVQALLIRGDRGRQTSSSHGLINGAYLLAEQYFARAKTMGYAFDVHLVNVGLQTLTKVGKVNKAFGLLNECCLMGIQSNLPRVPGFRSSLLNPTSITHPRSKRLTFPEPGTDPYRTTFYTLPHRCKPSHRLQKRLFPRINLNSITMNDFIISMIRMARHDGVWWIFRNSAALYNVQPDSMTIHLLMQAARKSWTMARRAPLFGGSRKESRWRFWSNRSTATDAEKSAKNAAMNWRDDALNEIVSLVGASSAPKPTPYNPVNPMPVLQVWKVFWDCVVSQEILHPGKEKTLLDVRAPANLYPRSDSEGLLDSFVIPLPIDPPRQQPLTLRRLLEQYDISPEELYIDGRPRYPQVLLQDGHFRDYILLLAVAQHGDNGVPLISQLPLVLAWQRHLNIRPSKDTLAAALVLFIEHGGSGLPLVEEIKKWTWGWNSKEGEGFARDWGGEDNEYVRFVRWIESWIDESVGEQVGEGASRRRLMPDTDQLSKWREIIMFIREEKRS